MMQGAKKLPEVLKAFGYTALRPGGQSGIVRHVMGGADLLGIMPTSGGKSACWQVPAACHGWRVLVFCPLTALIQDQVQSARRKGLRASALSGQNTEEMNAMTLRQWEDNEIDIVFSVPERIRNDVFERVFRRAQPDMVVVDEAHTMVQWGDTFRTAFSALGTFIENLHDVKSVVALTATASGEVRDGITEILKLPDLPQKVFMHSRDNLKLHSAPFPGAAQAEDEIARASASGPTLVYCATQKNVERVGAALSKRMPAGKVGIYHGGLPESYKQDAMNRFMSGQIVVMVATNAFGLGVDKADIRNLFHYDQPGGLDAWTQEVGRAARDGKDARIVTWHSEYATKLQTLFIKNTYPVESDVRGFFAYLQGATDINGEVNFRTKDIADALKTDSMTISTMTKILEKAGCLTKTKIDDETFIVRFLISDDDPRAGKQYPKYRVAIGKVSKALGGSYGFTLAALAKVLGVGDAAVRKNLNDFDKAGIIQMTPPEKGNTYKVRRSMDGLNLSHLSIRRAERMKDLDTFMRFLTSVPDAEKHEFVRRHFAQSDGSKS